MEAVPLTATRSAGRQDRASYEGSWAGPMRVCMATNKPGRVVSWTNAALHARDLVKHRT